MRSAHESLLALRFLSVKPSLRNGFCKIYIVQESYLDELPHRHSSLLLSCCNPPVMRVFSKLYIVYLFFRNWQQGISYRLLLAGVISIKNLSRNRNCCLTAGTAILHDHGNHQIRIIHIGIADKPGMAVSFLVKLCGTSLTCYCIASAGKCGSCTGINTCFINLPRRLASLELISRL